MKHIGLFAAGLLFGTAGLKILTSKDAKKVYAHTTAAALRARTASCTPSPLSARAPTTSTPTPRPSRPPAAEAEAETIEDTSAQEA